MAFFLLLYFVVNPSVSFREKKVLLIRLNILANLNDNL